VDVLAAPPRPELRALVAADCQPVSCIPKQVSTVATEVQPRLPPQRAVATRQLAQPLPPQRFQPRTLGDDNYSMKNIL
jgi:hypothetical protein